MAAEAGDVVIRKRDGRGCTVEIYPDAPQVSAKDYPSAVRLARGFCRAAKVRQLWFVDRDGRFAKVEQSDASP